jgi:hypothetical protein
VGHETTYKSRFTTDRAVNLTDDASPALLNVGRQAANLH